MNGGMLMQTKSLKLLAVYLVVGCVLSFVGISNVPTALGAETPVETPTAQPVETPTSTPLPVETPTNTPVVESATATPVPPPPTNTPVPVETPTNTPVVVGTPTETPTNVPSTPTNTPVPLKLGLVIGEVTGIVGKEIVVPINIINAEGVDAFGFDILQSTNILGYVGVEKAGSLTDLFLLVNGNALVTPDGAVRIGGVGGGGVVNGSGVLLNIRFTGTKVGSTTLSFANLVDDVRGAEVATTVIRIEEETVTATPTPESVTPTPPPATPTTPPATPTPESVTPTPQVATPTPESVTPTPQVATPTPESVTPTPTPVAPSPTIAVQHTPSPVAVFTPTASPTAITLNPNLGFVGLDELGGTYPEGAAVHNFDLGISSPSGPLAAPGVFDGLPDPDALGPFLYIDSVPYPIARDMKFTGEIKPNANGSEGIYFLIGGSIGIFPPVSARLGAVGGPRKGGMDIDNNAANDLNFGTFTGDIIPVLYVPDSGGTGTFIAPLVKIEPAGNNGFYVLASDGNIYTEGDARAALRTKVALNSGATATAFTVFRGRTIDVSTSIYSKDLIGTGAYVLDSKGFIYVVGDAPAINTANLPVVPQKDEVDGFVDIKFIPNAAGTEFIGLGVLTGAGLVHFVPFADVTVTDDITNHIRRISPFGNLKAGFPIDIARGFGLEISDNPVYGLDFNGKTIKSTGRRVGMFLFDGFGGIHTGGDTTRFAPAFGSGDRDIEGKAVFPFPVSVPYFGIDVTKSVIMSWPVQR